MVETYKFNPRIRCFHSSCDFLNSIGYVLVDCGLNGSFSIVVLSYVVVLVPICVVCGCRLTVNNESEFLGVCRVCLRDLEFSTLGGVS